MCFWYFAEGTSRGSGEPALSQQKTSGSDLQNRTEQNITLLKTMHLITGGVRDKQKHVMQ